MPERRRESACMICHSRENVDKMFGVILQGRALGFTWNKALNPMGPDRRDPHRNQVLAKDGSFVTKGLQEAQVQPKRLLVSGEKQFNMGINTIVTPTTYISW